MKINYGIRKQNHNPFYIIAINVLYIDRVEDNTYSLKWLIRPRPNIRTPALGVLKFTILVDPSLVIIIIYLVCLIYAWE